MNTAGLLLILFGLGLLVLELKVPSFGVLGVGGSVSLVIGSVMMTTRRCPASAVGLGVIVPAALGSPRSCWSSDGWRCGAAAAARHRPEAMLGDAGRRGRRSRPEVPASRCPRRDLARDRPVPLRRDAGARRRGNGLTLVVEPAGGADAPKEQAWKA